MEISRYTASFKLTIQMKTLSEKKNIFYLDINFHLTDSLVLKDTTTSAQTPISVYSFHRRTHIMNQIGKISTC